MNIDTILQPWQRFGVHLGLDRMQKLLTDLGDPHLVMPIIHVAGSNGKGSVCAYLTSVLTTAGYRVGCYTSPHLVSWHERITVNLGPIANEALVEVLEQVKAAIPPDVADSPTQFEVITAAAWLYFAQEKVDIAVIEVGLGGRLDATNVVDRPLVSVITSLSLEHTQQLGDTLAKIAYEKAGIIKPNCPVAIAQVPPEAKAVFLEKATSLDAPITWVEPAQKLPPNRVSDNRESLPEKSDFCEPTWAEYQGIQYPLALLGEFQLMNSALAIAAIRILQNQGWEISLEHIQAGMEKTQWQGRMQWLEYSSPTTKFLREDETPLTPSKKILIDGAHNPAAAIALRQYVDSLTPKPVNWVMGILSTKDHRQIFQALLRPQDHLYLVPVPDHSSADPKALAILAQKLCPDLASCRVYPDVYQALDQSLQQPELTILCGSLYLVGYFLGQQNLVKHKNHSSESVASRID